MALKYFFEYDNLINDFFRCEISKDDYLDDPIKICGSAILQYSNVKDIFETIRASSLTINLLATKENLLDDLYTEDNAQYRVQFFKNSELIFLGFINPDGIYTDYTAEYFEISISCIDGLGLLKDLAFVRDGGLLYTGKFREIDIIAKALHRTGFDLPINTSIGISFEGMATGDVLNETYNNVERFKKEDGKEGTNSTIMDCEAVIKSILQKYNAVLTIYNSEWYIYRISDFTEIVSFNKFIDATFDSTFDFDTERIIGSHIKGFELFHANSNQKINIEGSTKIFRVNYKYGLTNESLVASPEITHTGGVLDDWFTSNYSTLELLSPYGVKVSETIGEPFNLLSPNVPLLIGDTLTTLITYKNSKKWMGFLMKVKITDGTQTFYLNENSLWVNAAEYLTIANAYDFYVDDGFGGYDIGYYGKAIESEASIFIPPVPITGTLTFEIYDKETWIYPPGTTPPIGELGSLEIYKVDVKKGGDDNQQTYKGEFHTAERNTTKSTSIKDNITVYNGDIPSALYQGTIYDINDIPTEKWSRNGVVESKPILRIMVEDVLRINQKPFKIFDGDLYGFIPYLSLLKIDNFVGNYQILEYQYNTLTNITRLKSREVFSDEIDDIDYQFTYDYGNVVKPTIK